jgi:peptidoglycan-N-acetylglucosamine deacetylase
MVVRAFSLVVAVFYLSAAQAAECNYSEQHAFLSRVVAIDSAGGPIYRTARSAADASAPPSPLELGNKEVLLVFDQGPNPAYTRYILDILDRRCAKAVFFFSGNAAMANPDAVQDVVRRGHTIAAGPWSTAPNLAGMPNESAQAEIERGFAAVAKASGGEVAPFFSAPGQNLPQPALDYLRERGISLWPVDVVSGDLEQGLTPPAFANRTLDRLRQAGRGIIEFHDTRKITVDSLDSILVNLKSEGFKLVQILPVENFSPKEEYLVSSSRAPATVAASPTSGAFIEEAKRQIRIAEEQKELQRRAAEVVKERQVRQETVERQVRQDTAERRERQEAEERRERQEAAERRSQARYAQRQQGRTQLWGSEEADALDRRERAQQREAAERQVAQARYAERMERRNEQLRQEAALRRARQEAAERRAQARSEYSERRRSAQQ